MSTPKTETKHESRDTSDMDDVTGAPPTLPPDTTNEVTGGQKPSQAEGDLETVEEDLREKGLEEKK